MKTIYLDILLLTNFAISLAFLSLTKKITHAFTSKYSILIASIIGSLSSLVILIQSSFLSFIVKISIFVLEIMISFKETNIKKILKLSLVLLLLNIGYYGLCIIFWNIFKKRIFYIRNLTIYFDIDTKLLIFLTVIFYMLISLFEFIKNKAFNKNKSFVVFFKLNQKEYKLTGICDTANNLVDLYYNKPVVVITSQKIFSDIFPHENNIQSSLEKHKLHIIPCKTIVGDGIIYVTKPMEIKIMDNLNSFKCEACIGIMKEISQTEKCIFNPKIIL